MSKINVSFLPPGTPINITIFREGVERIKLPLIAETSSGYICGEDNSSFGSCKGEWFPKNSERVISRPEGS